jgi:hypothetical protein
MEAFADLSKMSIEEVTGTLKSSDDVEEEAPPPTTKTTEKVLLTHAEWLDRYKPQKQDGGRGGSNSSGRGKGRGRGGKPRGCSGRNTTDTSSSAGRVGLGDTCKRCGKRGHWAQHCRRKLKTDGQAHVAQEEEEQALLSSGLR